MRTVVRRKLDKTSIIKCVPAVKRRDTSNVGNGGKDTVSTSFASDEVKDTKCHNGHERVDEKHSRPQIA